jgi:hypothetical protein
MAIQKFRQADLQLQLIDEQAVEFGKRGAESSPAKQAQLSFCIEVPGMASTNGCEYF